MVAADKRSKPSSVVTIQRGSPSVHRRQRLLRGRTQIPFRPLSAAYRLSKSAWALILPLLRPAKQTIVQWHHPCRFSCSAAASRRSYEWMDHRPIRLAALTWSPFLMEATSLGLFPSRAPAIIQAALGIFACPRSKPRLGRRARPPIAAGPASTSGESCLTSNSFL